LLKSNEYKFYHEREVNTKFDFSKHLKTAKNIEIISLSACNLVTDFRLEIGEALKRGCHIRILVTKPNSEASKLVMEWQEKNELAPDLKKTQDRVDQIKVDAGQCKGSLKLNAVNWIPSSALIIVDRQKDYEALLRLKVYPLVIDMPLGHINTHMVIERKLHPELFDKYVEQFEYLWQQSETLNSI